MNYRQFIFAREYRGLNQTQLSNSIKGLSQSNLSKFEKGLGTLSEDIQMKIIEYLNFPIEFFNRRVYHTIENDNYRKRSSINKSEITRFETRSKLIGYLIDEMSESIEWPSFEFLPLNVDDGFSPSQIAQINRKKLGINPEEPVRNIFTILENNGIIIYEIDEIEKFDGVSFITKGGYPVIIINKKFSNDRKRFTLAHELAHLLLHNESNFPVSDFRDREKEANEFASEFLMPESAIKNSLRGIRLNDAIALKNIWLTSMSSLFRRAKDLGCISDDRYRYFMIEMSRNGYNKKEPMEVFIDAPNCIKSGYNLMRNGLAYNTDDFVNSMALPEDIINDIFDFSGKVKLKVYKTAN